MYTLNDNLGHYSFDTVFVFTDHYNVFNFPENSSFEIVMLFHLYVMHKQQRSNRDFSIPMHVKVATLLLPYKMGRSITN